ncbi:MAG: UDP-N-acetylmuramoyl-tripeptide--D-alanyl-D-alanine ligase [Lachnospiraceae bacterium]|jgi:UDP-N-acetylmuramoyl-tripeptide--D-alanyl-D-alanine ligase|nr:UDP-N-acetylmuramoyl-tripeptide--D-alanyl-D-alanine ligase [Lachnospiraceae bacterium]
MTLQSAALACGATLVLPPDQKNLSETVFQGAQVDSRRIEPGMLFFATPGARADGHQFIGSVFEKGAVCVVTTKTPAQVEREYGVPQTAWGAYLLVTDSFLALKQIAEAYRRSLTIPVVGITGSVGKTSTKECIAAVLSEKMRVWKTQGNYNNEIGLPLTILGIAPEHEVAVLEMGISDFGEMRRLSKMARPTICVITNIGQSHLLELKSREGILRAKSEIFEYMSPDALVCLNADDDMLRKIDAIYRQPPFFYGYAQGLEKSDVYATQVNGKGLLGSDAVFHLNERICCMQDSHNDEVFPVRIPLPGRHMVENALAAACVATILGLSTAQIADGLAKTKPVAGRSRVIETQNYVLIDDCYNANPVSVKAAIDLLCESDTPKAAILGDMLNLGEDSARLHKEIGEYAIQKGIRQLVFIGKESAYSYEAAQERYLATAQENKIYDLPSQSEIEACSISTFPNARISYYETVSAFLEDWEAGIQKEWDTFAILVKASHGMEFYRITDKLLETANKVLE